MNRICHDCHKEIPHGETYYNWGEIVKCKSCHLKTEESAHGMRVKRHKLFRGLARLNRKEGNGVRT